MPFAEQITAVKKNAAPAITKKKLITRIFSIHFDNKLCEGSIFLLVIEDED